MIIKEFSREMNEEKDVQIKKDNQLSDKKFCTTCGKEILGNSRFCIFYGAENVYEDKSQKNIVCYDIELTEVGDSKVVKAPREVMKFDLKNAK